MLDKRSLVRMTADEVGQALTQKQRAFVDHYVSEGCSVQQAAGAAGYSPGNEDGQRTQGYAMLHKPHVQAYMFKRLAEQLAVGAPRALGRLTQLSQNAKSEYVQLEASKDLLERAGIRAPDQGSQAAARVEVVIDLSAGTGGESPKGEGGSKNPPDLPGPSPTHEK